jgi:hypothetical protein
VNERIESDSSSSECQMRSSDLSLERYRVKASAESLGAPVLLDKLYSELIPAIKQFCPKVTVLKTANPCRKNSKQPSTSSIKAKARGSLISRHDRESSLQPLIPALQHLAKVHFWLIGQIVSL